MRAAPLVATEPSGVEVDVRFYAQFEVGDDKVIYIYHHDDRAAALGAVRLQE